ncbi:MAG: helix-turn-helix transcriptional regulator [Peptococcaceae bacterium]|nr:helix-turn-helix transcriptional regulator [Peptococcaceae bacterium]
MTLGENIKARRQALKLSQEYVAEQLGISRQAVAKWEANKSEPTAANLAKLASILEVRVSELVETEPITTENKVHTSQAQERQHNLFMLNGRSLAYILVDASVMGYFRYYPNDAPGWWWVLIFFCGIAGLSITSYDMYKRAKMTKDQIAFGALFLVAALFLPRWLPFSVGWSWFVSSIIAAGCLIYLNLKPWRRIWPVFKA